MTPVVSPWVRRALTGTLPTHARGLRPAPGRPGGTPETATLPDRHTAAEGGPLTYSGRYGRKGT